MVVDGCGIGVEIVDFGLDGMRLAASLAGWKFPSAQPGARWTVSVQLPRTNITVQIPIEVRHHDQAAGQLGVQVKGRGTALLSPGVVETTPSRR
jgi:hypothetical protein